MTPQTSLRPRCSIMTSLATCSDRTPSCFTSARAVPKPSTPRLRYTLTGTNITATPLVMGATGSWPTSLCYTRRLGCHPTREATSSHLGRRTRSGWRSSLENGSADSDSDAFLATLCFPREKSWNRTTPFGVICRYVAIFWTKPNKHQLIYHVFMLSCRMITECRFHG